MDSMREIKSLAGSFLLPFLLFGTLQAQMVRVDIAGRATVDGRPFLRIRDGEVRTMNGELVAIYSIRAYEDPAKACSRNPSGRVEYWEVWFRAIGKSCQTAPYPGDLAADLRRFGVVRDGKPDREGMERMVEERGRPCSERRREIWRMMIGGCDGAE